MVQIFGSNSDITRDREMEEELRNLAAGLQPASLRKDELLATLAHEPRNPLGPVRNGLQVMKPAGGQQVKIDLAQAMVERQLTQLVRLADGLMDVGRIGLGAAPNDRHPHCKTPCAAAQGRPQGQCCHHRKANHHSGSSLTRRSVG